MIRIVLVLFFGFGFLGTRAQIIPSQVAWEAGSPFITNYTSVDYKAESQNWRFVQADNGIMYVGNGAGVLEFDGVTWRLIELPNKSVVRSFAKAKDGTIYVGGAREFGYLKPDSIGQMEFQSLLPKLAADYHNFTDIWHTYAVADAIYFISKDFVFRWEDEQFKVWQPRKSFGYDFLVNDRLFVFDGGVGLKWLKNDSLQLAPFGDKIPNLTIMLPYDKDRILAIERRSGCFIYDFKSFSSFRVNGKNLLEGKLPYTGIILPDGDYLVTTLGYGVFVFDHQGRIKSHLTKQKGLSSDVVYDAFVDRQGDVWLATDNGISRLELSSPMRILDDRIGFSESANLIGFHLNELYVSGSNGLFFLNKSANPLETDSKFIKIDGINEMTRSIIPIRDDLWVSNLSGVRRLNQKKVVSLFRPPGAPTAGFKMIKSRYFENKMYVANNEGYLYELHQKDGEWKLGEALLRVDGSINHLVETADSTVWLSTELNGISRVEGLTEISTNDSSSDLTTKRFNDLDQLLQPGIFSIAEANGVVYCGTSEGIYRFNHKDEQFQKESLLEEIFENNNVESVMLTKGSNNSLWICVIGDRSTRTYKFQNNKLSEMVSSRRFSDRDTNQIDDSGDGFLFFSVSGGVIVYKEDKFDKVSKPPIANLRKVALNNDSVVYAGGGEISHEIVIPFKNNALRFEYALASFDDPAANRYQYFLEGFDDSWSNWTEETKRDFTNLHEGSYRFLVKGKNLYGQQSEEVVFAFSILPPWYRTWWAYLFFGIIAIAFVGLVVRLRSQQLRNEKELLEDTVKARTTEVVQKNQQLKNQATQLEAQTDQLKEMDQMKSRLFANISHEFRTPLTLIKGPIANYLQNSEKPFEMSQAAVIDHNADRLLRLVNQLLDLSKLDAGNLSLDPTEGDIIRFLNVILSSFNAHAQDQGIRYDYNVPDRALWVSIDRDKLEKILYNLLSNAFKFTSKGGSVSAVVTHDQNQLQLKIQDTGEGISPEELERIFDRFYQVDSSQTRSQDGTGIGLALTKELVQLMGGEIIVESEVQKGSTFTVTLQLDKAESMAIKAHKEVKESSENKPLLKKAPDQEVILSESGGIILIVEDNAELREYIKEQFPTSYQVLEAADGMQGWEKALATIPDLIITDLMMPKLGGTELCKRLKSDERTSHIPVVMLTAKAGMENKLEGLETGADSYLTKPFDPRELSVRIKNLIEQRKKLRELFAQEISIQPDDVVVTSIDERFIQKALELVAEHLDDSNFNVPQMQEGLGMSKTQLHRKMKAVTDQSPGAFIRNYRLKRAAQILAQNGDNVTQVAYAVGFNNLSYFAKCFKELYHVTPSEFMEQEQE